MAKETVLKGINPVPALTPYIISPASPNVFVQKLFPSSKKIYAKVGDERTGGATGSTAVYTVPDGKVFIFTHASLAVSSVYNYAGISGENYLYVTESGINLSLVHIPHFSSAGAVPYCTNQSIEPAMLSMFVSGAVFKIYNEGGYIVGEVHGFEIDKYEWDKFITPS